MSFCLCIMISEPMLLIPMIIEFLNQIAEKQRKRNNGEGNFVLSYLSVSLLQVFQLALIFIQLNQEKQNLVDN